MALLSFCQFTRDRRERPLKNIFRTGLPDQLPEELVEVLAENRAARIERIVSRGHCSPPGFWYDQELSEFVLLLQGDAKILFAEAGESVRLKAGDYLIIPPHRAHRVEWTAPGRETIWLAVYF